MIRAFTLYLIVFFAQLAVAHDLDFTLIRVERGQDGTSVQVTTALSRFVQSAGLGEHPSGPSLDATVRERLRIGSATPATLNVDTRSDILTWSAKLDGRAEFAAKRFDESRATAQTLVATIENRTLSSEVVLKAEEPQQSTTGMLETGVHHIISGPDHILFIVGLALLGGGWKTILKVLTAFTVAHSMTLLAAASGWIHGNPKIVEPLIALSIVALAIEGMRQSKRPGDNNTRLRVTIAFGFGLIHGFGFAGGLTDLGLQGSQLLRNLVAFSTGIELGQIAILVPTVLFLALMAKAGRERAHQFSLTTSVCLGMVGCFWFVERVL